MRRRKRRIVRTVMRRKRIEGEDCMCMRALDYQSSELARRFGAVEVCKNMACSFGWASSS
jgi:hypothetical protein